LCNLHECLLGYFNNLLSWSPSRTVSTMSLTVRPTRRVLSRSITRSQSFAGVNSHDKPYRHFSVFSTPGCTRKTALRGSRMFTLSAKSPPPKVPQPERLDEVYEALKRGLQSYLHVHQLELDNLNRQMKESKRNSRLGFLYELDKQVKVTERFMRRLEFHLSKIDELYEAYCMQRRLRDGANKMVKAYTASPGSREARESLSEANKGYKEYTENMCMLESELENQLGEFHIKMKGLAGFARLCAGDQYEIFMKYGRQRWKLRGRIEINGKQVWDSEDMVFLPLITEFLSIKVTELKSLANHVVVGNVCCETKDLFAALPQTVAVDINDLGTIKLSLEVTWNPFDKDDQSSSASTVNKAPSVNKRFSTYNQSPPDTPSLREQAFYNMLRRQEELDNGTAWSNSSESSDDSSSPQLSMGLRHSHKTLVQPEVQVAAPPIEIAFTPRESATSTPTRPASHAEEEEEEAGELEAGVTSNEEGAGKHSVPNGHNGPTRYSRSLSHISESSIDGALTERSGGDSAETPGDVSVVSVNDILMGIATSPNSEPRTCVQEADKASNTPEPDTTGPSSPVTSGASSIPPLSSEEQPAALDEDNSRSAARSSLSLEKGQTDSPVKLPSQTEDRSKAQPSKLTGEEASKTGTVAEAQNTEGAGRPVVDIGLEEALSSVSSSLDDYRGQFPELQALEQELRQLEDVLLGRNRSRSSSVSLTVENALGSFDFLNTTDLEDEEEEEGGGRNSNVGRSGSFHYLRGTHVEKSIGEATSCEGTRWESPSSPVSSGSEALDQALLVHLRNCSIQLLRLGTYGPLRCGEMYALDYLLREARVLELICRVTEDWSGQATQAELVVPQLRHCQGALSLWKQCTEHTSVYITSVENFINTLAMTYSSQLSDRTVNLADTVFLRLVERILERKLPRRAGGGARETLTIFQFWKYLEAEGVSALDAHVTELAEEVWLVQCLQSGDQDTLLKILKKPPEASLKREGLHTISRLLTDPRGKVCSAASSLFRSLTEHPLQRERALVNCLELLEDDSVDIRVAGCKALACLKAKESIEQLVYLCRTDKEDVRDAAKQALLVLGEEGKLAYRHVESAQDSIPRLFAPGSMASTAF
uniref:RHO family interacting cell polarization regulator 1 n=1 Tax=Scleropages formosus TaxID=113540 RepID=A0A8C9WB84_SCLFO